MERFSSAERFDKVWESTKDGEELAKIGHGKNLEILYRSELWCIFAIDRIYMKWSAGAVYGGSEL